jgi:hypothetical protein
VSLGTAIRVATVLAFGAAVGDLFALMTRIVIDNAELDAPSRRALLADLPASVPIGPLVFAGPSRAADVGWIWRLRLLVPVPLSMPLLMAAVAVAMSLGLPACSLFGGHRFKEQSVQQGRDEGTIARRDGKGAEALLTTSNQ